MSRIQTQASKISEYFQSVGTIAFDRCLPASHRPELAFVVCNDVDANDSRSLIDAMTPTQQAQWSKLDPETPTSILAINHDSEQITLSWTVVTPAHLNKYSDQVELGSTEKDAGDASMTCLTVFNFSAKFISDTTQLTIRTREIHPTLRGQGLASAISAQWWQVLPDLLGPDTEVVNVAVNRTTALGLATSEDERETIMSLIAHMIDPRHQDGRFVNGATYNGFANLAKLAEYQLNRYHARCPQQTPAAAAAPVVVNADAEPAARRISQFSMLSLFAGQDARSIPLKDARVLHALVDLDLARGPGTL